MATKPKTTKPAAKPAAKKTPGEKRDTAIAKPVQKLVGLAQVGRTGIATAELPLKCLLTWDLNPRQASPSAADDQAVRELADSIEAQGLLSPLLVRDTGRAPFVEGVTLHEVIAGERRRRAMALLRDEDRLAVDLVPVRIVAWDDAQALLAAGAENLARADMHAMDEALLFQNLVKTGMQERDIAAKLGVGERTVYRRRRLCRLVPDAQTAFRAGKMSKAQAEALAGGAEDRQISMLPELLRSQCNPGYIARVMTKGYPVEKSALFSMKRYRDAGGRTDVVSGLDYDDKEITVLLDVELFRTLQEEAIADRIGNLSEKWRWVDRLDQDEYPFEGKNGYSRNGGSLRFPGAGALVVVSPDLTRVNVYEDVLKPGHLERWQNAVTEGGEEALTEAREAEEAGEVPEPPAIEKDGGEEKQPGEAARLMTQPQIEFVRRVQTEALREAVSTHPIAGLAWTILVMMGAVAEISVSYGMDAKAVDGDECLIAVFDRLRPIWPGCPTREELEKSHSRQFIWREKPWLAASCFEVLIEEDGRFLTGLLAEVAASRIACWHNPYVAARTPFVSPLNAVVARAARAEAQLPEFWNPEKEFWKGYDLIGLKAALAHAEFDPAGFHGAKKGELVATLCDVSSDLTADLPELRFLTMNDQEDAAIAARAKVLDATSPATVANPAPAADDDAGDDEQREAA